MQGARCKQNQMQKANHGAEPSHSLIVYVALSGQTYTAKDAVLVKQQSLTVVHHLDRPLAQEEQRTVMLF